MGHRVGRSTSRRILKAAGLPPVPQRPTWWRTFLNAHWGVIAGADFFTTEVWTWRGLITYYTVFVIDLASRRVQILGSTPHPDALFMEQVVRTLRMASDAVEEPPQAPNSSIQSLVDACAHARSKDQGHRAALRPVEQRDSIRIGALDRSAHLP